MIAALLVATVSATVAAAAPAAPSETDKAVAQRVTEYWKARATMNLQAVYPFYEPEFRAKYSADVFARDFRRLNRFAPEFMGVEGITVEGKKATVKVKLKTKPDVLMGQELVSVVDEVWVSQDGAWYRVAESLLPNI
ncbi:MAG: hypothetical protein ABW221_22205 [Vicinamibacteria bacterium]